VEYERKISRLQRLEINDQIPYTLQDYRNLSELDPEVRKVRLVYHIVKVERTLHADEEFQSESIVVVKHHDWLVSRKEAVNQFKILVQDPSITYSEMGITNFNPVTGTGYVLQLFMCDLIDGSQYEIYSTKSKDRNELLENRKRERRYYNYYGFEYPIEVENLLPWD